MKTYDNEYISIVEDILSNKEFNKIKYIEHHGITRFDHSIRVSYLSYKIARFFHLKSDEVARAGLLHDFFLSDEERTMKDKFLSTFTHPKKALKNAKELFELTKREENIIVSHMFPINFIIPRYLESIIVSSVDKLIALYEFSFKFRLKFKYVTNLYILVLFGIVK